MNLVWLLYFITDAFCDTCAKIFIIRMFHNHFNVDMMDGLCALAKIDGHAEFEEILLVTFYQSSFCGSRIVLKFYVYGKWIECSVQEVRLLGSSSVLSEHS